jgi:hypothetical protein
MTQTEFIKRMLEEKQRITQKHADSWGIKRLGARIWELRHSEKYAAFRRRYRIKTERKEVPSRWGTAYVAEYRAVRR